MTTIKKPISPIAKGKGTIGTSTGKTPSPKASPSVGAPVAGAAAKGPSVPSKGAPIVEGMEESFDVEWRELKSIKRYGNNPRKNSHTVKEVIASIKAFGWQQPIVVDEEGVIIVGDTRYCAAVEMKLHKAPVKVATGLTPAQVRAYRLVDNKVGETSQWDENKLIQEMLALAESGENFDLTSMGFSDDDLAALEPPTAAAEAIAAKYLEDFDVMPAPTPRWILISAPEAAVAHIIKTVEALGYEHLKIESSAYPSAKKQGKLN